jgi:hypothetical protein
VLLAHVLNEPQPMSAVSPDVASELDLPVLRMLAKEPADRPASALEALDALQEAAARAGLAIGADVRALPRPTPVAAEPSAFEAEATVEQSGMREGHASQPGARWRRWMWVALLPLVGVSWFFGDSNHEPEAAQSIVQPAQLQPSAAPAQAPQPAAEAPPPQPPPAPEPVRIRIRGAARGAEVFLGDRKLGAAEDEVLVPYGDTPVQLTVTAPGRPSRTVQVTPNAAAEIDVPPEKRAAKRPVFSRDLENPF